MLAFYKALRPFDLASRYYGVCLHLQDGPGRENPRVLLGSNYHACWSAAFFTDFPSYLESLIAFKVTH